MEAGCDGALPPWALSENFREGLNEGGPNMWVATLQLNSSSSMGLHTSLSNEMTIWGVPPEVSMDTRGIISFSPFSLLPSLPLFSPDGAKCPCVRVDFGVVGVICIVVLGFADTGQQLLSDDEKGVTAMTRFLLRGVEDGYVGYMFGFLGLVGFANFFKGAGLSPTIAGDADGDARGGTDAVFGTGSSIDAPAGVSAMAPGRSCGTLPIDFFCFVAASTVLVSLFVVEASFGSCFILKVVGALFGDLSATSSFGSFLIL